MPVDQTTRRLDRLETKLEERGELVDISWINDVIAQVYQCEREPGRIFTREEAANDFTRILLTIFGHKTQET